MGKHQNVRFIQLNRAIFSDEYEINWRAKWLYTVLSELEHRYTGKEEDFFFRSTKDLINDTGMSANTIRKYRRELVKNGLLKTWQMHWNKDTGKKSEKHITAFKVLR